MAAFGSDPAALQSEAAVEPVGFWLSSVCIGARSLGWSDCGRVSFAQSFAMHGCLAGKVRSVAAASYLLDGDLKLA